MFKASSLSKGAFSVIVTVAIACTWTASTQLSRAALSGHTADFAAPYFLMWFHSNFIITCYPAYLLSVRMRKQHVKDAHEEAQLLFGQHGLCLYSILKYVLPFLFMWTGANYLYARCLGTVSASIATSISSSNAAIVYVLTIFFLKESFRMQKVVAVTLAVGGVTTISLDPQADKHGHWIGYLLAVLSAIFSACYKVMFKQTFGEASIGQVSLFMTCLGALNLCINVIPAFTLAYTVETLHWAYVPWGFMTGGAFLALLFDFLINFGIALLNPLTVSIGMLIGIPLNTVIDMILHQLPTNSAYVYVGTILIITSFFLIIMPFQIEIKFSKNRKIMKSDVHKQFNYLS